MSAVCAPPAAHLLLVDDHTLFRTGLRLIVQDHPQVAHITEAGSIAQACALAPAVQPPIDLVLLDIQMPGMNGLDGMRLLRQNFLHARVVVVSASVAPDAVREARARGADGFLPKCASSTDIWDAITLALQGQPCFPDNHLSSALPPSPPLGTPALTARQRDVLQLLCAGKPNKVIARDLGLSENTVRVHVAAIFAQLGVNSRSSALLAAQRLGLVDTPWSPPLNVQAA